MEKVNQLLNIGENDAFILVADEKRKARNALEEVQRRAKMAMDGVPEETRKALEDANTEYLRPLPTASRMYVETDIPTQVISQKLLENVRANLPELPEEKKVRIIGEYGLSDDLASTLVKRDKVGQFEEITRDTNVSPTTAATPLAYTEPDLRRDGCDVSLLTTQTYIDTLKLVDGNQITVAAIPTVLRGVCETGNPPLTVSKKLDLLMLSDDDVKEIVTDIVESNLEMIKERSHAAMGPLMGMAMKELKGKADGKLVNKLLKEEIQKYL